MKIAYFAYACLLFMLMSCEDDYKPNDKYNPENEDNYLPLEVGNYWKFVDQNAPSGAPVVEHREVTGKATFNGHEYFVIVSTRPTPTGPLVDSGYYRIAENGYAFTFSKYYQEELQNLRLSANDGDTWTYTYDDYDATVTLSDISLELGSQTVANCKNYYVDTRQMADEEYTYVLARGIGFAKEYSNAWGLGQRLQSARIHGVVRDF